MTKRAVCVYNRAGAAPVLRRAKRILGNLAEVARALPEGIGIRKGKARTETTVVVAMSGGVDSSVAASLLVEAGYRCIGVMMRLWAESGPGTGSTNKCCSLESVNDARAVAETLGIPFYLINVEEPFKRQVVDFYIEGSLGGLTPNPCMECNRHIRFDYLLNYARRLGADFLATGHYARLRRADDGRIELRRAVDEGKDQSYVLSVLGQDELESVLFPLGEMSKPEVRAWAQAQGLPVASKHDSMDLCFLADGDHRRFLRDWSNVEFEAGPIVDRSGREWGRHDGLAGYTLGQRKGLGIHGAGEPLYVVEMDAARNALVVGPARELGSRRLRADRVTWVAGAAPEAGARLDVKVRYKARPVAGRLARIEAGGVDVELDESVRDVTPGQSAVFYADDVVLGGGVITEALH